jgi:D-alanyl-D-alanine carboxypeptidase
MINQKYVTQIVAGLSIIALAGASYTFIQAGAIEQRLAGLEAEARQNDALLTEKVTAIETLLASMQAENEIITDVLEVARTKSEALEEAFSEVNENVEILEKITTTDPELLQKYSKIYFLNEHYVPEDVRNIPSEYVYNPDRTYQIHTRVWPYLKDLLEEAEEDGLDLQIISAFRSFGEQAVLKGAYTVTYGAGSANAFSADQGYSEHQLGTTVDFTNSTVGATFSGFARSAEYAWLLENAHEFGFILSYPEGNGAYQFEPWHWRFVGVKLASDLHRKEASFYDWSQRDIDEYVTELFE